MLVGLERAQHVEAIDLRHFEIQQQHRRIPGRPIGVRIAPVEIVEGLGAVPHDHHFVREVDLAERRERQLDIIGVVFRENDAFEFGHHSAASIQLSVV